MPQPLSDGQWGLLAYLQQQGGSISDASGSAARIAMDAVNGDQGGRRKLARGGVRGLAERGYITRDVRGRKTMRISLTKLGRRAVRQRQEGVVMDERPKNAEVRRLEKRLAVAEEEVARLREENRRLRGQLDPNQDASRVLRLMERG